MFSKLYLGVFTQKEINSDINHMANKLEKYAAIAVPIF